MPPLPYLFVPRQLKSSFGDAPRREDNAVQSECTKRTLLRGREGADSAPPLLYRFVPRQFKSSFGDAPRRNSAVQSECTKRTLLCGREGADSAPPLLVSFRASAIKK